MPTIAQHTKPLKTQTNAFSRSTAFGTEMQGRSFSSPSYRYAFNGMEKDDELKGQGNSLNFSFRLFDSRIGKFLSPDPLVYKYPWNSVFVFAANSPISGIDLEGLEYYYTPSGTFLGQGADKENKEVRLAEMTEGADGKKIYSSVDLQGKKTKDWVVVHKNHDQFIQLAAMIHVESSGNKDESYAIGTATVNASIQSDGRHSVEDLVTNNNFTRAYGTQDYNDFVKNPSNDKFAIGAAINASLYKENKGGTDYSGGAVKWEGAEFAAKGNSHYKAMYDGVQLVKPIWDQFRNYYSNEGKAQLKVDWGKDSPASLNDDNHRIVATKGNNKGRVLLISTAVHGGTIFFGPNTEEDANKGFDWKYLSTYPK